MQPNRNRALRNNVVAMLLVTAAATAAACSADNGGGEAVGSTSGALSPQVQNGRDIWLKATFGGEKFFSLALPQAPFNLTLGFVNALTTPRAQRFTQWGLVNDPDCSDGDATTGGFDRCPDPSATGVVGIRKGPDPTGTHPFLLGVACAGCHAGLSAQNPPGDPNHPAWDNIDLTTGNQYIQAGKIFSANLPPADPRWQVFHTWAAGAVDTTAIESDGINNPGIITQFFEFPERPYFSPHSSLVNLANFGDGTPAQAHRAGQGGEDDVGCQLAALRVYFNIGMCAAECMIPHLANGLNGTQTPIDLQQCATVCPDLVQAETAVVDECAFINNGPATPSPSLEKAPGGAQHIDHGAAQRGGEVFESTCASCHSNGSPGPLNDYTDDLVHVASGFNPLGELPGDVGTNKCRALSTNWDGGHIWAEFSSDELKARGPGYSRDVPLLGIWATAPFFHNNRLGAPSSDPSVAGRLAAFDDAYSQLVNPWTRDLAGSVQVTTVPITVNGLTLPAGTPVALFANLDPTTFQLRCDDLVENGGHYFGALLSPDDKNALKEYLKTL